MARRGSSRKGFAAAGAALADRAADGAKDRAVGWTTLVSGVLITAYLWWRNHDARPGHAMGFDEYNLWNTAFCLWVPLLIILFGLRREPAEFGLQVGDLKQGMKWALLAFLLFVPVILYFARAPGSQAYYIGWLSSSRAITGTYWNGQAFAPAGRMDWERLFYHEMVMGFYMFGWEFFFRGYLLNGLKRLGPLWAAVLIQAVIFTAMHWSKPPAEVASSFPGAILMALLAVRTKSFLPCFVLHWLVSAGFDGAVLYYHFRS